MVLDCHYTRTGVLGTGGFGTVYRALRSNDTLPVAIKVIPVDKVNSSAKLLAREVDIMHQLSMSRHECVMGLTDALLSVPSADAASQGAFEVHLVMPLYASTLHNYAQSLRTAYNGFARRPREVASAAPAELDVIGAIAPPDERHHRALLAVAAHAPFLAFRLTAGLQYIHQCRLAHRDLKPVNVMVTIDHSSPRRSAAVLGDFGLCNAAAPSDTFYVGTRQYRAPEMITNISKNSAAMDLWSLGCTFFEIVTGGPLFGLPSARDERGAWSPQNASAQLEALLDVFGRPEPATIEKVPATNVKSYLMKTRDRPCRVPELVRQNFKLLPPGAPGREELVELWVDLIMRCLRWLPEERPTCKELLQHPLFRRAHCFVVYSEAERAAALQQHPDALVVLEPQPISYKGGATKETKEGNKEKIRLLVQHVNASRLATAPVPAGQQAAGVGSSESLEFPIPTTPRVRSAFADFAALMSDPIGAYTRAAAALGADLTAAERSELDAVRRFCEHLAASAAEDAAQA